ncbi:MAG: hypothetical protein AAF265_16675, partial [Pseudomonadota bacterium]
MKQRRWVRRVGLSVIVILGLIVLGLGWLLGTRSGARWSLSVAMERAPFVISVEEVNGSLLGGLSLHAAVVESDGWQLSIDRLYARVRPSVLWNFRQITVADLSIDGLQLILPPGEPKNASVSDIVVPPIARVSVPLSIDIEQLSIRDGVVRQGTVDVVEWNAFDFEGSIRSSILTARAMSLETGAGRIAVSGSVEMGGLLDSSL